MIQRIQSLFLFLASTTFAGQFFTDFAKSKNREAVYFSDYVYDINDNIGLLILTILGIVVGLGAIFLFRNRPLQARISNLGLILSILLPSLAAFLFFSSGTELNAANDVQDQFGLYLPVLGIIFFALSSRFIKKDEKLVKSMDRLR